MGDVETRDAQSEGLSPAAWHPDPEQAQTWRFWDGEKWTDDRAPMGKPRADSKADAARVAAVLAALALVALLAAPWYSLEIQQPNGTLISAAERTGWFSLSWVDAIVAVTAAIIAVTAAVADRRNLLGFGIGAALLATGLIAYRALVDPVDDVADATLTVTTKWGAWAALISAAAALVSLIYVYLQKQEEGRR